MTKHASLPPGPMLTQARKLLAARPRHVTLYKIHQDTQIPLGWLKTVGRNKAPDVNRIERLIDYLNQAEAV